MPQLINRLAWSLRTLDHCPFSITFNILKPFWDLASPLPPIKRTPTGDRWKNSFYTPWNHHGSGKRLCGGKQSSKAFQGAICHDDCIGSVIFPQNLIKSWLFTSSHLQCVDGTSGWAEDMALFLNARGPEGSRVKSCEEWVGATCNISSDRSPIYLQSESCWGWRTLNSRPVGGSCRYR